MDYVTIIAVIMSVAGGWLLGKIKPREAELKQFRSISKEYQDYASKVITDLKAQVLHQQRQLNGYKSQLAQMEPEDESNDTPDDSDKMLDNLIEIAAKQYGKDPKMIKGMVMLYGKKKVKKLLSTDEGKMFIEQFIKAGNTGGKGEGQKLPDNLYSL